MSDEQQTQQADDPSGPGWRDVEPDEILQVGDMFWLIDHWELTQNDGGKSSLYGNGYRRRIEQQQQPSDSEPDIVEDLRRRLAECEVLLAEAERGGQQVNAELQQLRECFAKLVASQEQITAERDAMAAAYHDSCIRGQQVNAELQQLREQVQTLTRERDRYRNQLEGALEHASNVPRNFRERMVLEKYRAFVEAKDDDPLTFGYVQLRATDPHVLGCSEFVVESWHEDVGGGRLSECVRVFLRHYASEEDQESRKEISARTYFHVRTVGDYERLLSLLGIGGNESGH